MKLHLCVSATVTKIQSSIHLSLQKVQDQYLSLLSYAALAETDHSYDDFLEFQN